MLDDNRPILTLTLPKDGVNEPVDRILIGMHDYYTGLDLDSFLVALDVSIHGLAPAANLASQFHEVTQGVWELKLQQPLRSLPAARIYVSVKDRQGNLSQLDRRFSVK